MDSDELPQNLLWFPLVLWETPSQTLFFLFYCMNTDVLSIFPPGMLTYLRGCLPALLMTSTGLSVSVLCVLLQTPKPKGSLVILV